MFAISNNQSIRIFKTEKDAETVAAALRLEDAETVAAALRLEDAEWSYTVKKNNTGFIVEICNIAAHHWKRKPTIFYLRNADGRHWKPCAKQSEPQQPGTIAGFFNGVNRNAS